MDPTTNTAFSNDDDYSEGNYAGDPLDKPTGGAAEPTSAQESTYAGDTESTEEKEQAGGQLQPDAARTLNTIYKQLGLEEGRINFDDKDVDFASLTEEEQLGVWEDKLEVVRQQVRDQTISDFGLSPEETAIIDQYRANNNSLVGLVGASAAANPIAAMTHDELHQQAIRSLLGDKASEQQVTQSLETRRTSPTYVQEAEAIRNQLATQAQQQAAQLEEQDYQDYSTAVTQAVQNVKNIAGVEITAAHHQYAIEQLTKRDPTTGLAPFIADLSDEKKLGVIAIKALLFDNMVDAFKTQKGATRERTVNEILGITPTTVTGGAAPAGSNRNQPTNGHQLTNADLEELG